MVDIHNIKKILSEVNNNVLRLETNILELITLINRVDGSNTIKITNYIIDILNKQVKITMSSINNMYTINRLELPNLFSELNTRSIGMINQSKKLEEDLQDLKQVAYNIYSLYMFYAQKELDFLGSETLRNLLLRNTGELIKYMHPLMTYNSNFRKFRYDILINNDKLVIGGRR